MDKTEATFEESYRSLESDIPRLSANSSNEAHGIPTLTEVVEHPPVKESDNSQPTKVHHPITYRPDIDGLRALAVVPVVIFHAYPDALPGGFIGVDIFFVISGYLISSILFKEHTRGSFTYADFYSRRIRRIFPALILVLAFTLTLSCLWLLAKPLKTMAATLVAGGCFGANLQLLTYEQGYFDSSIKENPLLHLWSLGVEEQFYIFWPFFAALVVRMRPRYALVAQVVVVIASFVCNIAFLNYHGSTKYSFYFPLSRFWQMAIGGLVAFAHRPLWGKHQAPLQLSAVPAAVVSCLALAGTVVGYAVIQEADAFPGYWALLPTLSAAAFIVAGPSTPFNRYILGSPPMVFIGNVSYGFYLWHWPMLVLAKSHYPNAAFRPFYMAPYFVALVSFVCSIVTLYALENHLRRRKGAAVVLSLVVAMVTVVGVGIAAFKSPESFSTPSQEALREMGSLNRTDISANTTTMHGGGGYQWSDINTSKPPRAAQPTVAKINAASSERAIDPVGNWTRYNSSTGISNDGVFALNINTSAPVLYILGDSHSVVLGPRFTKLYEDATTTNAPFPMVVLSQIHGTPTLSCASTHVNDLYLIKMLKPKAVLYSMRWPIYFHPTGTGPAHNPPNCCAATRDSCDYMTWADARALLDEFQAEVAGLVRQGIKVFVATINPEGPEYHFENMLNGNAVGNTSPVNRTTFRQSMQPLLNMVESAIVAANATIVDYSDNQCWGDVCEVVSTSLGEPIYRDTDHFRSYYVRNYLSVLDQVVHAALA
ncbi:Aste57867_19838 [Aphanomyces stellatus]|uniref:Aste57867_19838 protein n=1 Tax=Aphanomyces stellatus TaxID=120398 RepID=A0A485LFF3_9STRA|nr:hypothetical protein As57867_019773 [Aphanomyces stellatus]VFT96536.1 Aste57867_19838 [Aphanomyces stellatus]